MRCHDSVCTGVFVTGAFVHEASVSCGLIPTASGAMVPDQVRDDDMDPDSEAGVTKGGRERGQAGTGTAAETPAELSRSVMFCHVLHAPGTYSVVRSGMTALSFQAGAPGNPPGAGSFLSSAWIPPLDPVSLPPPACGGSLFCARFACAGVRGRGRAYRGGAVRAPDCPRETADAPRPSAPAGVFFAAPAAFLRRKAERRPPGSRLSLLSFYTISPNVKLD